MARPKKNNADYFSHDADMRNHRKIKSIRTKFGIAGYAVWSMTLEFLTSSEGNKFSGSEDEIELIAGDFGISVTELQEFLSFFVKIKSLFIQDGFYYSVSLNERLAAVYEKRAKAKEHAKDQPRIDGKFTTNKPDNSVVSVTETPQSKVNEIKGFIEIGAPAENFISVKPKYANDRPIRIYDLGEYFLTKGQLENFKNRGWTYFAAFFEANPARVFNDEDHVYNAFKDFSTKYQPKARAPGKFEKASENKALWTLAAWEEHYEHQLKTNPEFRKYFGYAELPPRTAMGIEN